VPVGNGHGAGGHNATASATHTQSEASDTSVTRMVGMGERHANSPSPIRVALIDDHQMFGEALGASLRAEGHQVFIPALTSAVSVLETVVRAEPHVILLDLDLGTIGSGQELLGPLVASGMSVLVVSATAEDTVLGQCLQAGAAGWVSKSAAFEDLLDAVCRVAQRRPVIADAERQRLISVWEERSAALATERAPFEHLTRREAEVLALLVAGRSVERIAAASFVSETTVRTQVRAILFKLGVNSQLEAVAMAVRAGWRSPDR